MSRKSNKVLDRDVRDMSHEDFVVWFMAYFKSPIDRCIHRRLIPNRYEKSDVRAYIIERILDILKKREAKGRPIEDPKLYFRKLIDFYCVEYQRMHGFIYGMPKRPRCPEAEQEISKYGFVYFNNIDSNSNEITNSTYNNSHELAYIDANLSNPVNFDTMYQSKGGNPDEETDTWNQLMLMALPEDRELLTCLFRRNMSVPEASRFLEIAVSTAYTRRDRGLRAISGTLCQFVDLDKNRWEILEDITDLDKDKIDISNIYNLN